MTDRPRDAATAEGLAGKYLTFNLASEQYGLEILKVREIIGMTDITPVPCMPEHLKGVINLRGRVIPVVDLRRRFGMPPTDRTRETCIIVVTLGGRDMGAIVDRVSEVVTLSPQDIGETPAFGTGVRTEFILGMGKAPQRVTILLNIDNVLVDEALASPGLVA